MRVMPPTLYIAWGVPRKKRKKVFEEGILE